MAANDDFRGAGWAFPLGVDPAGGVRLAREDASVAESIRIIIGTARGERAMRPTFGCGIHDLVFAPNSTTTAALVSFGVREALIEWEPRVEVRSVQVAPDPDEGNTLLIEVEYRVRRTNNVFNLVYPFYLQRGEV